MMKLITADKLKDGDVFRSPRQRKWRTAARVFPLQAATMDSGKRGILVCHPNCNQTVFEFDDVVEISNESETVSLAAISEVSRRKRAIP